MADFSVMPKMLPALPQAFGNLKDVFRSANDSLRGESNPLGLVKVKNSLVIMVDGLGWFNLTEHIGHVPFLKQFLHKSSKGYSGFPSTTAASIVSFATGSSPSNSGFIGYRVFDRSKSESVNLLTGLDTAEIANYLLVSRISDSQPKTVVVSKPEYEDSGFSSVTFKDVLFRSATGIDERFEIALDELNSGSGKLIYLYIPELDQAAHRFGYKSNNWLNLLELLDSSVRKLVSSASSDRGIVLTADHGIIDVPESAHVYLDECDALAEVLDVAGDPRVNFIYFTPNTDVTAKQAEINDWLADRAQAFTIQQLVEAKLYEESVLGLTEILPDLVLLPSGKNVCYHRHFAKAKSLQMIGQHGGISETEITIPILRMAAYSSSLLVP